MMLGRNVTLPLQAVVSKPACESDDEVEPDEYITELQDRMCRVHALARGNLKKSADYNKHHYDIRAQKRVMEKGQAVWLYDNTRKVGVCQKLTSKWKGPCLVLKRIDDINYLVQKCPRKPAKVYHIDRLLPYKGKTLPLWFRRIKNKL